MTDGEEDHDGGSERWLLTYSDMITLLLALFVILFAISSVNKSRFAELKTDLHASFNGTQITPKVTAEKPSRKIAMAQKHGGPLSTTTTTTPATNTVSSIKAQLVQALNRAGLLHDVQFASHNSSLVLGFVAGKTFYSIDSAQLSPLGSRIVDVAGSVLRQHPNPIDIDGYTDNEPIYGGPYKDNWQLSSRALVVVEQLQHAAHVNPSQLYAVSLGQYHPLVPNDSPGQQAENRRVNIVVSPVGQQVQP
jgi:chemotaxis protein MotB